MLRLTLVDPLDTLWDGLLPAEVSVLPPDLARLDEILAQDSMLVPFREHWDPRAQGRGRPTIPMAVYLRLMIVKHRTGWGYESLVREVSDSLHLRRFCLVALHHRVPHESTVRKLTRRLGSELVSELIRGLIEKASRERRFRARAMRCDSTVVSADIRYPTDSGLCGDAVQQLARVAKKLHAAIPSVQQKVRDRSRAVGLRLRALSRSLKRRTGEAKQAVRKLTEEVADQVRASVREARRLLAEAQRRRSRAQGVSKTARRRALTRLEEIIVLAERVVEQVRQRFAGEKISDRLVSLADPDARPVRRGKRARPNEFGYVMQLTELTPHTQRGARGLILPPKLKAGSTHDNTLLPETVDELTALGIQPKEAVFDGGFSSEATAETMSSLGSEIFIVGRPHLGSRRTRRRLARYRVGCEGRIAHLKREYGAGRSRLRGTAGAQIWESWTILAYDLDTVAEMKPRRSAA